MASDTDCPFPVWPALRAQSKREAVYQWLVPEVLDNDGAATGLDPSGNRQSCCLGSDLTCRSRAGPCERVLERYRAVCLLITLDFEAGAVVS